jgi:HEAT repeat protein
MLTSSTHTTHYTAELALLGRAARGEHQAMHEAIQYLSSANPYLRQIMQATLHECTDPAVWQGLVRCMGEHCWEAGPPDKRLTDIETAYRLDESIRLAFTQDYSLAEGEMKLAVLQASLRHQNAGVRYAAACLLGLRGDLTALPALKDALEQGELVWQVRAIRALVVVDDPRCGPLLLWALSQGQSAVHQEAGQAVRKVANSIQQTLAEALQHPDNHVRWHAACALVEIGDMRGVDVVTDGLLSESRIIRFASAEALASLGERCVPGLLNLLSRPGLMQPTLQAVGHAFNAIESHTMRQHLHPLLLALQDPTSSTTVSTIAQQVSAQWHLLTTNQS